MQQIVSWVNYTAFSSSAKRFLRLHRWKPHRFVEGFLKFAHLATLLFFRLSHSLKCRVFEPTCNNGSRAVSRVVLRHVSRAIARPSTELEHVFSFASGFIRADLHKHHDVLSSNKNHKILWSQWLIIKASKPGSHRCASGRICLKGRRSAFMRALRRRDIWGYAPHHVVVWMAE